MHEEIQMMLTQYMGTNSKVCCGTVAKMLDSFHW